MLQNLLHNEYELYDNLLLVDNPTNEGSFYSLGEYIYAEQLSEGSENPFSNETGQNDKFGEVIFRFDVNLDRIKGEHEREIYHLLIYSVI
jgi:hypothetical protein